ncbi:hypothetical protein [Luteimonas kalidii]|uniref:Uncharacterized protein n=1 Tax=Luteimonas kalidii TaxID=3042025 RepID=A0ABT6JSX7_9GAMM|nr:hypothetical protein [Luteimonas kalidii]MDH5833795.1 hypothetical protein [Luteimonas kalidii]
MNRKLRHTILAFSVTGMVLALGLLAARPVLDADADPAAVRALAGAHTPSLPARSAPLMPLADTGTLEAPALAEVDAVAVRLQARGRQYEAALVDTHSVEQAVALTVSFVTTVVAESLLAKPLGRDAGSAAVLPDEDADAEDSSAGQARRSGSVRSAIAVPYFSFARGTGRGGRS